ncbi:MAG: stage V sporulation protein D [Clostridiaceae bacterium]|nr:stage V sporulation protein D [Clostridiaceae bacterium]
MLAIYSVFLLLFFGLIVRVIYIGIYQGNNLKALATEQWTSQVTIDAKRGRILDSNGVQLAISADVYRIDLDLKTIISRLKNNKELTEAQRDLKLSDIAKNLATATGMKYEDVNKIVNGRLKSGLRPPSVNLIRRIEKAEIDKVRALNIYGVIISGDTRRFYPNDNYLAHVLGFTDINGKGEKGVELTYNTALSGTAGKRIAEVDKKGEDLPYNSSTFTKPIDGKDLVLSIDSVMQHFSEQLAEQAMKDYKAKAVSIIISNPNNGEILAMVNKPDFNPNIPRLPGKTATELNQMWRNRAVSDVFELGSVMKVITAGAAMQEKLTQENDSFDCNGYLMIGKTRVNCDAIHNHENLVDIIKNSCNVGFMQLGDRLGKEKLTNYLKLFGFGQKTGIDLGDETKGIAKKPETMTPVDLANLAFGQGDAQSCIQYIEAFNAVANGGKMITPHVMKAITHVDEENKTIVDETYKNVETKQILSPEVMKNLRGYLEKVVTEGTGTTANIEGYRIAGKTGTAQKPINGIYPAGKYVASFVGMVPVEEPQFTVLVSVDEPDPSKHFASETAAPVSKQVFLQLFNYLSLSPAGKVQGVLKDVVIPEVRGVTKADASNILMNKNITYDIEGTGNYIVNMQPLPGTLVKEGGKVKLTTGTTGNYEKIVIMPGFSGYSKDKILEITKNIGLTANFQGEGVVKSQDVKAGTQVRKGSNVKFVLQKSLD